MENSTIIFQNNIAAFGETLHSKDNCITTRNSNVIINDNTARWDYGGQLTDESNDITIDANGVVRCTDHKEYYICTYTKCFCKNLKDIPSHAVVSITENITLSSTLKLTGLVNISLIGYNNSIQNAKDGGLKFVDCKNVTITNIIWNTLISSEEWNVSNPQLKFYGSSSITIQKFSFQQSMGQAVLLSDVSGDVNFNYCEFVNNSHYKGHGAAIATLLIK